MQNEAPSKRFKPDRGVIDEYKGYTGNVPGTKVEEWNVNSLKNKVELFTNVVKPRKPIKIVGGLINGVSLDNFRSENIVKYLGYDDILQVERKHASGFGLGFGREDMYLEELLEKFKAGEMDYYLTTQYEREGGDEDEEEDEDEDEDEDEGEEEAAFGEKVDFSDDESIDLNNLHDDYVDLDEEEAEEDLSDNQYNVDTRLRELLQPPLTNLYLKNKEFPLVPDLFPFLIPQQINLWLGANKSNCTPPPKVDFSREDLGLGRHVPRNGLSSGLHHDHSDNLYILFQGWKRFTLYPPSAALALETVGKVCKIYESGIIDYEHPGWRHVNDDGSVIEKIDAVQEQQGKEQKDEKNAKGSTPPSFSKIPPIFLHLDEIKDLKYKHELTEICQTKYPELLKLNKLEVLLSPGEMLYLPAGWFHEVTSYGFDPREGADKGIVAKNNVHIALNYWFAPPNGESVDKAYRDSYWAEDFKELVDSFKNVD